MLGDIHRVCPAYDEQRGFDIAGSSGCKAGTNGQPRCLSDSAQEPAKSRYANYSRWLSDLIRDVRKDLQAPKLPFVIGVMGVGGAKPNEHVAAFR